MATFTVGAGQTYTTIQAAIDAASNGDTIVVQAGTYTGNVLINKSLTLQGANVGKLGTAGDRTAESLIQGFVDTTSGAGTVILDGFRFEKDPTVLYWNGTNVRMLAATSTLENSIIQAGAAANYSNSGNTATLEGSTSTVRGNLFLNALNPSQEPNLLSVRNTTTGITTATIEGNTFQQAVGSTAKVSSIALVGQYGTLAITGNTITGGGEGIFHFGLPAGGTIGNLNIENNTISNTGKNGIGLIGWAPGFYSTVGAGRVQNNTITGSGQNSTGSANIKVTQGTVLGSSFTVFGNDLSNPQGTNKALSSGVPINASGNWWGSTDEAAVAALISDPTIVDFAVYLGAGTDSDPAAPGFQNNFSNVYVTNLGAQTGATGRVAEAIGVAASGGLINVNPGTYAEGVVTVPVDKTNLAINIPAGVSGFSLTLGGSADNGLTVTGDGAINITGNTAANTLTGNSAANTITGGGGVDNLSGGDGNDTFLVAVAELSSADTIDGDVGSDQLIFTDPGTISDNQFTNVASIESVQLSDGTNSVSFGVEAEQAGITTVTGSTGDDTLNLLYGTTGLTFNAGTGSDTLSYSADSMAQAISLSAINAGIANGSVSNGGIDSFTGLEAIVGGSGTADSITSTGSGETLILTGENAGTIDGFAFSGVESVDLGDGNDTAMVETAGSLSGTVNLGGWNDTLSYAGYAGPVTAMLSGANTLSITAITGGVTGVEFLTLSADNDTLTVGSSGSLGGDLDFAAGNDTLSYAGYTNPVTVSLNSATSTAAAGATGITGSTAGFESLIGGIDSTDTLNAASGVNTLVVASGGVTTLDTSLTVSAFETINLGAGSDASADSATISGAFSGTVDLGDGGDTATINDGGSITSLSGGDGTDTLNLDGAKNSITVTGTGAGTTAGTTGGTTTFSGFETVNGLAGTDAFTVDKASTSTITLAGGDGSDSLSVAAGDTTANSLTLSGSASGTLGTVAFSGMETINLGSGGDTATILSGGLLSGNLNFGAGTDTLNYASYDSAITVDFKTVVAGSGTTDKDGAPGIRGVVSGVENIIGSNFNDTLDDSAVNSIVVINGANSGNYNAITFSSIENLLMGGGVDAVTIASGGSISGDVALGGGTDNSLTLDVGAVSVGSVRSFSGKDSVTISGGSIIGALDLGDGTDSLSYAGFGSGVSATLSGADTLSATTAIGGGVTGVENITLSSNNDTITVADGGMLSGTLDLGDGNDTLSYAGYTNPVTVSLNGATSTAAGGATHITGAVSGFESLVGGNGGDTLNANAGGNTLIVAADSTATLDTNLTVSGFETINLGVGDDTATIINGGNVATLVGGDGNDTLNLDGAANSITITGTGAGTTAGTSGGNTTFTGFETVNGLGGSDAFIVNSASSPTITLAAGEGTDSLSVAAGDTTANSLTISGSGSGTLGLVAFSGLETINLGSGGDSSTINNGGLLSGNLNLGDGNDTLSYAGYSDAVTVSLNGATSTAAGGATGITGTVSSFETLVGGSGSTDILNANAGVNTLSVAADGSTTLDSSLTVSGFETINLGSGSDSVTLAAQFFGTIDGGAGDSDVLNLNASANDVTFSSPGSGAWGSTTFSNFESVNLLGGADSLTISGTGSFTSVDGGSESDSLILALTTTSDVVTVTSAGAGSISSGGSSVGSFTNFESIDLGGGSDTLTYASYGAAVSLTLDSITSNAGNTITGGATGFSGTINGFETVVGSTAADSLVATSADNTFVLTGANQGTIDGLSFSSFESVDLAGGNDSVQFTSGDSLSGTLAGGGGNDALDYSTYGSAVTVNLANGTATATGGISGFETVLGSSGADTITASTSGDVNLQGNGGIDTFNVTVAGLTSADTVAGGADSDTLVFSDAGTITDVQFTNVTTVESVTLTGASTISAGTEASQAGIATINTGTGATTVNSTLAGYDLTVNAANLADSASLTLTGSANTNDFTVTGLSGSVLASGTSGTLAVTTADAIDNAIGVTTGSGNTTITGSGSSDTITVNADAMADNTSLDINGSATYTVSNLEANTDAAGSTGTVNLAYTDVTDNAATISTGSGATTISGSSSDDTLTTDATNLQQNTLLSLFGAAKQVVTNLIGNLTGTSLSGSLEVTTADAADDGISITTGSANTTITANGTNDTITVNADGMVDNSTLDINGSATFTVSNLEANTDAAGSTGTVNLAYTNVTDNAATISTGSGATTVSGTTSGDTLTINAASLTNDTTLTQSGAAQQVVTGLVGDISATALSGTLTVTTGDNSTDDDINITTGTANTTISANGSGDTITVNADALADNKTLDINGSATFTVSNLEANTDAAGTSGTVSLAYADVTDNAATITIGSGPTTVSGTSGGDTLTINANNLANDTTLTQSGAAQQVVTSLKGDISATALTGTLSVTTGNASDDAISITTGTASTTITASGSGDTITVNADGMVDNTTLDINGTATFTVSNLEANTDAAGSTGTVKPGLHRCDR